MVFLRSLSPIWTLIALYVVTYLPMLFMRGEYWDGRVWLENFAYRDYVFSCTYYAEIYLYQSCIMMQFVGWFSDPVLISRIIIFFAWLIAGVLLYPILYRHLAVPRTVAFLVVPY